MTSHTALIQHVPEETSQCYKQGQIGGSSLEDAGNQKLLHSQGHFTRNCMGSTTKSRSSQTAARSTQKEKHSSSPMSGSAASKSWSRKLSHFMSLADYQTPWHSQAVVVFKYNEVFEQFSHRKASTKEISTSCKLITLSNLKFI